MPARPLRPRHLAQDSKIPQLTCEACNERKVRCDKRGPARPARQVVSRSPRGRHVNSIDAENQSLRERVARLEGLIATRDADSTDYSTPTAISTNTPAIDSPPPFVTSASSKTICSVLHSASAALQGGETAASPRYLANGFWDEFVDKNPRLHGVLSDQSLDLDHVDGNSNNKNYTVIDYSRPSPQYSSQSLKFGIGSGNLGLCLSHVHNLQSYVEAALALRPAPAICKKLYQAYLKRVDPLVRGFHRPLLVAFLLDGQTYLHYHDTDPVLDLLRSAVLLIAIVSLTEEQCRSTFDADRVGLIAFYRFACENALDRVGLITTKEISVLQSLVLYLFAVRTYDRSRTAWTLFSIAARLATAIELNIDNNHLSDSFFEQQMRRRLCFPSIVPLSLLLATNPPTLNFPLNINDSEYGPDSQGSFSDREGMTDMSKAIFHARMQTTGMALTFQDDLTPLSTQTISKGVSHLQQLIEQFELHTRTLLQHCDLDSSPYAWCTFYGGLNAPAVMLLALLGQSDQEISTGMSDPRLNTPVPTIPDPSIYGNTVALSTPSSSPIDIQLTAVSVPFNTTLRSVRNGAGTE
ncbi:hypothetical protein MMC15_004852 [Xylographa vitiligo]|nr:hypothetical protein [Xylographa vitiligo]